MRDKLEQYPYDEVFQSKLVALMIKDPTFLPSYADILDCNYFDDEVVSSLAQLAIDHYSETSNIPTHDTLQLLLTDYVRSTNLSDDFRLKLKKGLQDVYDVNVTDGVEFVKSRAVEFGKQRILQALTLQVGQMLDSGDSSEKIWSAYETYRSHGSGGISEAQNLGGALANAPDIVQQSGLYCPQRKVSTGFPTIDQQSNGGVGRKELLAFMGFTNVGKSIMLVNVGVAALYQHLPVVHISVGEMEWEDQLARYASRLSGIECNKITSLKDVHGSYNSGIKSVLEKLSPEIYFKYVAPGTPVSSVRAVLSRLKFKDGIEPALVLIDNADELMPTKSSDSSYEAQGEVYTELKVLAHDFDVAIVVDTQTNRHGSSTYVADLEVMGESHKKSKKVDTVISINQKYPEEYLKGVLRLGTVKARRHMKSGDVCWCKIDRNIMTIKEIPSDDPLIVGSGD